ncbi:hypothetical protein EJB05_28771 [Eragrostis curvula]|uniref:BRCT domain-containing protein n=1 Tax=Eragrostis curvula TaxID=38414 RepID=A0A5J9US79_9POAL|nr:hypothetical protein EJB05_28771 [Eragrostis curvula]
MWPRRRSTPYTTALRLDSAEVLLCAEPERMGSLDLHRCTSSLLQPPLLARIHWLFLSRIADNAHSRFGLLHCRRVRRFEIQRLRFARAFFDFIHWMRLGYFVQVLKRLRRYTLQLAKIEELLTAMGGLLQITRSNDVNFVIVKDVMAVKYKWAVNTLKKPVVTMNWLEQCWIEQRVMPHEPNIK